MYESGAEGNFKRLFSILGPDWKNRFGMFLFSRYRPDNINRPDWTRSYDVCWSWSRMKFVFTISCDPYKINNNLNNLKVEILKAIFALVRAEWNVCRSYIKGYEVISKVELV